jgi:hypothetical protein
MLSQAISENGIGIPGISISLNKSTVIIQNKPVTPSSISFVMMSSRLESKTKIMG